MHECACCGGQNKQADLRRMQQDFNRCERMHPHRHGSHAASSPSLVSIEINAIPPAQNATGVTPDRKQFLPIG